jgi:hypothetical protein
MMQEPEALTAANLKAERCAHRFFTRRGGVSTGVYESLNGGVGSNDAPDAVRENRRRMAHAMGVAPERLLIPYQIHSAEALVMRAPWPADERPRCDALVTDVPDLAIGVTGADCGMILLQDATARVIGAAHAGWKGAAGGVLEATIAAMESLGARRSSIRAALGPTIAQASYEVGDDFMRRFIGEDEANERFFRRPAEGARPLFDLPAYIAARLRQAEIGGFEDLALDTYADPARFFSYRRSQHRSEGDYGRLVSAIALA